MPTRFFFNSDIIAYDYFWMYEFDCTIVLIWFDLVESDINNTFYRKIIKYVKVFVERNVILSFLIIKF